MLEIKENIPLAKYTTFRIGGPARFLAEVKNEEELLEALDYAEKNNLEFFILGGGSNVLVNDQGYNGIIIRSKLMNYSVSLEGNTIEAGSGVPLALAVNLAAQNGLSGMEWATGIPGTVGGAVRGNAGAFGVKKSDIIKSVSYFNTQSFQKMQIPVNECDFGYRTSIFKKNPTMAILSALFSLKTGEAEEIKKKMREIVSKRIGGQPKGVASAGSFFMNPAVTDEKLRKEFEKDTGKILKDEKIPAGWLIDQADLKGKKIGGAMVSEIHTNYIVNIGNAKATDVIILASLIKQQVRDKFGVELKEEVQYLGF